MRNFKLTKYNLDELKSFVENENYNRLNILPITKFRAYSYFHNPRKLLDKAVIYMLKDNDKIIAYRTLLTDSLQINKTEKQEFAWLSGSFVLPEYRRQGLTTLLLKEICKDYNDKILYANYGEISHKVYTKTNDFELLETTNKIKYYIRFELHNLLLKKYKSLKKIKSLIKFADRILNFFNDFKLSFLNCKTNTELEYLTKIDTETANFISKHNQKDRFKRTATELNWIRKYPWVVEAPINDINKQKYNFSSIKQIFKNYYIKVKVNNKIIAFMYLKNTNNCLSTPYLYFDEEHTEKLASIILNFIKQLKINNFTTNNDLLNKFFEEKKSFFILKRKKTYNYYVHKKNKIKNSNYFMQDGDGDIVFT